jgi:subtilisin family serine protease
MCHSAARRRAILLLLLLAIVLPVLFRAPVASASVLQPAVRDAIAASAEGTAYVIVMLRPATGALDVRGGGVAALQYRVLAALAESDFQVVYRYETFAALTGRVSAAGLDRLAALPEVEAIGLDGQGEANLNTSVPFIGAATVQSLGIRGDSVTVAVLDSGIDTDHPDLSDDVAPGAYHFLDQGATVGPGAEDDNGHGTNVSGIITSRGLVSYLGVAPGTDILPIKVLSATNSGWLSDWAAGVDYVVAHRDDYAHLVAINMSLGSNALYSQCPCDNADVYTQLLQASLLAAKNAGITTFCSSGNAGSLTTMSAPACVSAATAVAAVYDYNLGREPDAGTYQQAFGSSFAACYDATTAGDRIACFSNRSPCNSLAAPGRLITAPGRGGGTSAYTGTSQASPHCAGTAALVQQARLGAGLPLLAPDALVSIMKTTGVATVDPGPTSPHPNRVAALAAVNRAVPPTVTLDSPHGGEWLVIGDTVTVHWSATDNVGVSSVDLRLSRSGTGGPSEDIALALANTGTYRWCVTGPVTDQALVWVYAHDAAGNSTPDTSAAFVTISTTPLTVEEEKPAKSFALLRLVPNPARGSVEVEFAVPRQASARLAVLDVQGRVVALLADATFRAGRHHLTWSGDGRDGPAPSGLYFVRMEAAGRQWTRRLAIVR